MCLKGEGAVKVNAKVSNTRDVVNIRGSQRVRAVHRINFTADCDYDSHL